MGRSHRPRTAVDVRTVPAAGGRAQRPRRHAQSPGVRGPVRVPLGRGVAPRPGDHREPPARATLGNYEFSDAVGAYVVAALVSLVLGATGLFGKLLAAVPKPITAGVLAGVLLPFATRVAPAAA